jgi:hypothetical protein
MSRALSTESILILVESNWIQMRLRVKHHSSSVSKTCATGEVRRPKFGVRNSGTLELQATNRVNSRGSRHCVVTRLVCAKQASGSLLKGDDE